MIEKVTQSDAVSEEKNVLLRLPKNIRQYGNGGNIPEIYIEDYAEGYLQRLAGNDGTIVKTAVLVGEFFCSEGKRYVFIRGAIEAEQAIVDNRVEYSSEVWGSVYEKIKRFFPQYEAVGWFLGGPGDRTEPNEHILHTHLDWFGGRDRVLYRVDAQEKEASFWIYEEGALKKWPGYCVYYDRNEEMQDFLVSGKPASVDSGYTEPVLAKLGQLLGRQEEQETPAQESEKQPGGAAWGPRLLLTAAVVFAVVAAARRGRVLLTSSAGSDTIRTATLSPADLTREVFEGRTVEGGELDLSEWNPVEGFEPTQENEYVLPTKLPKVTVVPVSTKKPTPSLKPTAKPSTSTPKPTTKLPTPTPFPTPFPTPTKTPTEALRPTEPIATPAAGREVEDRETTGQGYRIYLVQKGDTLAAICRRYYGDVSKIAEIKELNQILDENMIYAGQELILP